MGLIKAIVNSASSAIGDQFKEVIKCPTIEQDVLIQRGIVEHGAGNSNPSEGVITNGSKIIIPQGMAMMIVDNGAITEFSAVAGDFIYENSSEPSVFVGGLGEGLKDTIKVIGNRFTYGGQTAKDQRVYYVNLLKIAKNKFGSPQPKKITDDKYGILEVTFFGEYVFQVKDPVALVHNVIGTNPKDTVTFEDVLGSQLKGKFVEQLTQAITIVMRKHKIPFGDIGMYGSDISDEMNTILDETWRKEYGLEITDVAIQDINLTEKSMERVNTIDDATIFGNGNIQAGLMAKASADAMKTAAGNSNGAMMGFMGMGMAQNQGNTMMGAVYQNAPEQQEGAQANTQPEPGSLFKHETQQEQPTEVEQETPVTSEPAEEAPVEVEEQTESTEEAPKAKFCSECGQPVTGKFCGNCGTQVM
ncbi:MAG: SPFH domain-containing protein [Bacilli bacterium]|nr:SPFH domain-containing protein [Bacilli bacterium]